MKCWTIQAPDMWESLQRTGSYHSLKEMVEKHPSYSLLERSYDYIIHHMEERGLK